MNNDQQSHDARFGTNVRLMREAKGMTQAGLAEAMTARGWQWHQSTVARVESGQQSLRLSETEALGRILQTPIDRFTWLMGEAAEVALAEGSIVRLRESGREVADAIARLEAARDTAKRASKDALASKHERVRQLSSAINAELLDVTLKAATAEGIDIFRRMQAGE